MAITRTDIEGRLIMPLGVALTVNLNVVAVTTVFIPSSNWLRWMPLFMELRNFSTGSAAVPTATVSAGTVTAAAPVDFRAAAALSGNGPSQVFSALTTISPYTGTNNFLFAVTAGAVGTCDVALYGVVEGG
jgi:hypothetical protein